MLSITVCIFLSPHMHGGGYEGQDLLGFVKDKIAKETQGMTFAEFKEYIAKRKLKIAR